MDIGLIFANKNDGFGLILEKLGYNKFRRNDPIKLYGPKKDHQCKLYLDKGFAQIYFTDSIREDTYYRTSADIQNIGRIAPLLTQAQYNDLIQALIFAGTGHSGTNIPKFESILRDLSLNPKKYGFSDSPTSRLKLKEIQEAFGLIVNADYTVSGSVGSNTGINSDMLQWWTNFRNSHNPSADNLMEKIFQYALRH